MDRRIWFDRRFELGLPPEAFSDVLERVRGTPARIEERVRDLTADASKERVDGRWSIQENIGHLLDLESLWSGRLDDFDAGRAALRPADLENRKTFDANHHGRTLNEVVADFRMEREEMVVRLESLSDVQIRKTALHPRLELPMTVVDLLFFLAEHDDHHLVRVSQIISSLANRTEETEG